jgi:hypothetical protein
MRDACPSIPHIASEIGSPVKKREREREKRKKEKLIANLMPKTVSRIFIFFPPLFDFPCFSLLSQKKETISKSLIDR